MNLINLVFNDASRFKRLLVDGFARHINNQAGMTLAQADALCDLDDGPMRWADREDNPDLLRERHLAKASMMLGANVDDVWPGPSIESTCIRHHEAIVQDMNDNDGCVVAALGVQHDPASSGLRQPAREEQMPVCLLTAALQDMDRQ
ncbi:MAG: hypothetical protein GVY24_07665 [Planctomycetes bacterium]|jgi:hypothetical protein|nr:hypothetical protein [Planctomycetota bacterium]